MSLTSAELASHHDILTQILLRLPVRSLVRFKCVSKHWQYLVSSPRSALLHRKLNPNLFSTSGLFIRKNSNHYTVSTGREYEFVSFDRVKAAKPPFRSLKVLKVDKKVLNPHTSRNYEVVQSSNGLLLCCTMIFVTHRPDINYHLYNPTINRFTTIPKYDRDGFESNPCGMTLVFDPLKSPHYKLVCVRMYSRSCCIGHIEVYSSESRSWVVSENRVSMPIDFKQAFIVGVYWNGAVHWANRQHVFYLKVNKNCVDKINLPHHAYYHWYKTRHCYPLVESRESLLFINVFPSFAFEVDVYKMNTDYSGWSNKYHVHLYGFSFAFPENSAQWPLQSYVVHCFVPGEREEDAFLVIETPGKLILRYNVLSKTCQKLCDLTDSSIDQDESYGSYRKLRTFPFVESLAHV